MKWNVTPSATVAPIARSTGTADVASKPNTSTAAATQTSISWSQPAWWLFIAGGTLGTVSVTSAVILTPKLGAAAVMGLAVTGQLVAGLAVDRFGFLGAPMHDITPGRLVGAALLVGGALMIRLL